MSPDRPFWETLARWGDDPALLDVAAGLTMSYCQLSCAVDMVAERLSASARRLVFVRITTHIDGIVALLAVLRAGHCALVLDEATRGPELDRLVTLYRPDVLVERAAAAARDRTSGWSSPRRLYGGIVQSEALAACARPPHPDLALLLSTSGSTGSPKTVRLSRANVAINALQIAQSLAIAPGRRAALSLPLAYAYGLSVLTSHLAAGGIVALQRRPVIDPLFWRECAAAKIDTLPAVTFTLDFVGARWEALRPPSLKTITHAGGRLSVRAAGWLTAEAEARRIEVYRMYGMTEATARLAVSPSADFLDHPASVGRPVPGGAFEIDSAGQVVYTGPNVMMGYARDRADLAEGDVLQGRLETGDLGRLDPQGRLEITGRSSRIVKILGLRLNLADMEDFVSLSGEAAVVGDDERLVVYHVLADEEALTRTQAAFFAHFRLPPQAITWRRLPSLPRNSAGKILYGALAG